MSSLTEPDSSHASVSESGEDMLPFSIVGRAGLAILAAVVLVHLFAGPIEPLASFALHAGLITTAYSVAFALVYWLMLQVRHTAVFKAVAGPALVPVLSAVACLAGAAALSLLNQSGTLSDVIDVHDDASWILKLAPVWLVLTVVLFQSERSRALESELRRLGVSRARIKALDEGEPASGSSGNATIMVSSGRAEHTLRLRDISHIAAVENYCQVHFTEAANAKPLLLRTTFATLVDQLPSHFAKTHRSFAVNLSHVDSIAKSGRAYAATLSDGRTQVPVSRGSIDDVSARWRTCLQARQSASSAGERVAA